MHTPFQNTLLPQVATTTWYGTGPLMWMLSTVPPVLSACAFMRSTSSMIVASFPARVHGTNRLRGAAIFQSGRLSTPSSRKIFSSTSDYTCSGHVSARGRVRGMCEKGSRIPPGSRDSG